MKKRTLICIHVMPAEIEMFERLMQQMKRALMYLDENDDVTLKVTLNLNPELTDWESSELKNGHFISRFGILFNGIKNINEIIFEYKDNTVNFTEKYNDIMMNQIYYNHKS